MLSNCYLNGHALEFSPQTRKLAPNIMNSGLTVGERSTTK